MYLLFNSVVSCFNSVQIIFVEKELVNRMLSVSVLLIFYPLFTNFN